MPINAQECVYNAPMSERIHNNTTANQTAHRIHTHTHTHTHTQICYETSCNGVNSFLQVVASRLIELQKNCVKLQLKGFTLVPYSLVMLSLSQPRHTHTHTHTHTLSHDH